MESNNVLVLWNKLNTQDDLQKLVQNLTGDLAKVKVENVGRLSMAEYGKSTFNLILSGVIEGDRIEHTSNLLTQYLNILRMGGIIKLHQNIGVEPYAKEEQFLSVLKTSGFIIVEHNIVDNIIIVQCQKPNFEVGSSVRLSFANKQSTEAVWKIDDVVDEDIETVDPDTLLDEDDLKKPDAASLRVCGTTGVRKACKDCSCGLAEELDAEAKSKKPPTENAKSSCGSCYLGDAFRCASCPYLGMPAFKPGEKVLLSDNQLKADI